MLSWDDFDEKQKIAEPSVTTQVLEKEENPAPVKSEEKRTEPKAPVEVQGLESLDI